MLENESREIESIKDDLDITKYVKAHLGIPDSSELPPEQLDTEEELPSQAAPVVAPTEDDFDHIKLISNGAYG